MEKITIGICVYDDYDGAFFTLQSLRMYHSEVMDRVEFIVINNNPGSASGRELKNHINNIAEPVTYVEFTNYSSTYLRRKIFDLADTEYVLVLDCHVLLEPGSLKKLLNYYDKGLDKGNLLQGPLLYDDLKHISTHFDFSAKKWNSFMWGKWATDKRGTDRNAKPFEIPGNGLGLFSSRKNSWPGFNNKFRGFGGEEGYIHEKYKLNGKKTICLPFLRWNHRFARPNGIPYSVDLKERFRNYMIAFNEIGKDINEVIDNFKSTISTDYIDEVKKELDIKN
jgi:hypothetical protein